MAERETEAEWEKSKRIEAERMKAARALAEEKPDKSNLAFLDPATTKAKGWSSDKNSILASAEKIGNRAIILAISGVVLAVIGYVGGMVSLGFNLGVGGVIISGIPSGIGYLCMGIAVVMAVVTVGSEIYFKIKDGRKFSSGFSSAVASLVVVLVYFVLSLVVERFI
ncbi:hypothetical protein IIY24_00345 [Candidatus Saccharibacteria bacterium]|nr:hypothetical protein [Candidatus Saccharibacteria bacterium]